jgi:hypothetical protein
MHWNDFPYGTYYAYGNVVSGTNVSSSQDYLNPRWCSLGYQVNYSGSWVSTVLNTSNC